jgi:hypothetical protein
MMIDLRFKNIKKNNKKNWVKPNSRHDIEITQ